MTRLSSRDFDAGVAARIRAVRVQKKLSQTDTAAGVGVSYQQMQKYETGANRISARSLHKLAVFLDVPIAVFFEGQDELSGRPLIDPQEVELLEAFRGIPLPHLQAWIVRTIRDLRRATAAPGSGSPPARGQRSS
jgi:transcriptional regulator with XRE-family HTH domain